MAARNIAQIVVKGVNNEVANDAEIVWTTNNNKEIQFNFANEPKFYEAYIGSFDTQYWDIKISSDSMLQNGETVGLITEDGQNQKFIFDKNGVYFIQAEIKRNKDYQQVFKLVARTNLGREDNGTSLVIGNYSVAAGVGTEKIEAIFVPNQKILNPSDYAALIFEMDRNESYDPTMELHSLKITKMKNLLDLSGDGTNSISAYAATFETTQLGECKFIINDSVFYIGNDKTLEIPEELNINITNISFLEFIKNNTETTYDGEYAVCLINYKY